MRRVVGVLSFPLALLALAQQPPAPVNTDQWIDTEQWIGSSYTPARASNQLWWWRFDDYEADVRRELGAARRHLGFTSLRVFLHSELHARDATGLLKNVSRFLDLTSGLGITRVGFVLFDDCM